MVKHDVDACYECLYFLPKNLEVREVRIEAHGYAGQGVAYVSAQTGKGRFVPAGISGVQGMVEHPELVLDANVSFAFLGYREVGDIFADRAKAAVVNSLNIMMKKEN